MSGLIDVDLSAGACERPAYQPLEPGTYELEITNELKVEKSRNPGKDGINHGRIEVNLAEVTTGKTVDDYLPMSPKMRWKFNQFVASTGVVEAAPGKVNLADFKGRILKAIIGQRAYTREDGTTGLANEVKQYVFEPATPATT